MAKDWKTNLVKYLSRHSTKMNKMVKNGRDKSTQPPIAITCRGQSCAVPADNKLTGCSFVPRFEHACAVPAPRITPCQPVRCHSWKPTRAECGCARVTRQFCGRSYTSIREHPSLNPPAMQFLWTEHVFGTSLEKANFCRCH